MTSIKTTTSAHEVNARAKIAALDDNALFNAWETTEHLNTPEMPTVRGWLMDEIERRFPAAFDLWLELDAPEDKQLRQYCEEITIYPGLEYDNLGCKWVVDSVYHASADDIAEYELYHNIRYSAHVISAPEDYAGVTEVNAGYKRID